MFSLCIPTINRYDTFLKDYIPKYLLNPLISEIIITDENGNDIQKIKENIKDENNKLKLFKNDSVLGPFLNKHKACKLATNEWIALMDSDNFADTDYFITSKKYLENNKVCNTSIIAPSWAKPNFDYRVFNNQIITKNNLKEMDKKNKILTTLMNTGNYIINKYLIDNINLDKEKDKIQFSSSCDVIYFNVLLFEQFNLEIHIIADMHYNHVVHSGSIYINTHQKFANFNKIIHDRYYLLFTN